MGANGRHLIRFIILPSFLYMGVRDLVCWLDLCKKLIPSVCVIIPLCACITTIFYCTFSCYTSWTHPCVRCLYSCCYITWVAQWLRLALSKGSTRAGVFPLNWRRKQIQFPKRYVFLYSEFRPWVKSRNPLVLSVIHHRQNLTDQLYAFKGCTKSSHNTLNNNKEILRENDTKLVKTELQMCLF
jgi:hypothetical protein